MLRTQRIQAIPESKVSSKPSAQAVGENVSDVSVLQNLRVEIDALDEQLVYLLNERAKLVKAVGDWKKKNQLPVLDSNREAEIQKKVARQNKGPLDQATLETFFKEMIANFRQWEAHSAEDLRDYSNFEKKSLSIVGLGLMGSSCALALRSKFSKMKIRGTDPQKPIDAVINSLTSFSPTPDESIFSSDVILLASPILSIIDFLKAHAKDFKPGTLILDFGSTKQVICDEARKVLPSTVSFVGLHPLTGRAVGGSQSVHMRLFEQQKVILTKDSGSPEQRQWILDLISALGALPLEMSAEDHDQVLAMTSHLPQIVSTTLTLVAREFFQSSGQPLVYGPAFRDMTRLATSDFSMWKDIAATNSENILQAIALFQTKLEHLKDKVAQGNFAEEFNLAKDFKHNVA